MFHLKHTYLLNVYFFYFGIFIVFFDPLNNLLETKSFLEKLRLCFRNSVFSFLTL